MSASVAWQSLAGIGLMVVIAYGSRVLGLLVMSYVPLGARVRRFIDAMSSSVLIAVITPMVVHGDGGTKLAALAAGGAAIAWRNPLLAIALGMASAALWRWWWSG